MRRRISVGEIYGEERNMCGWDVWLGDEYLWVGCMARRGISVGGMYIW